MSGSRLSSVSVTHPRTARYNASRGELESRIEGRKVLAVGRHGKFILASLEDGYTMVAHLGMSGRFSIEPGGAPEAAHTHFRAKLDDGSEIRFIDPRTFGFVSALDDEELAHSGVSRLGPDAATDLPSVDDFLTELSSRSAPIKALLLDQRVIAGIGNIYADEALHGAHVHPLSPGRSLDRTTTGRLLDSISEVLLGAIERGGTTLDDLAYLLPDGRAGENREDLHVYGRTGSPCHSCGTPIRRVVVRSRSTHFCPHCQRT